MRAFAEDVKIVPASGFAQGALEIRVQFWIGFHVQDLDITWGWQAFTHHLGSEAPQAVVLRYSARSFPYVSAGPQQ